MEGIKYEWVFKKCLLEIEKFKTKNLCEPKYLFMNRVTFDKLGFYVTKIKNYALMKSLPSNDIYLYGAKIRFADIGDDEIFVVGDN